MNSIKIRKLKIIENEDKSRLSAMIDIDFGELKETKEFYYEVDNKWSQYLVDEYSDSFILAFLETALENCASIYFETPASDELIAVLEREYIPALTENIKEFNDIKLIGETASGLIKHGNVVGTGFSAGVDSFYTVLSHLNTRYSSMNVTYLVTAVNGAAQTGISEELDQKWFSEEMEKFQKVSDELGLQLIGINSNISMVNSYKNIWLGGSFNVTSSFIYALRKLFKTYYFASSYKPNAFKFDSADCNHLEILSTQLLSVDGLRFLVDGMNTSRQDKVKFIADNSVVQKSLTVCGEPCNCGECFKCIRTMSNLYVIGKLHNYRNVFPNVDNYMKHPKRYLAREIGIDHASYYIDIFKAHKSQKGKVPIVVYLWGYMFYVPFYYLKGILRNNKFIRKIYFGTHIYKFFGSRKTEELFSNGVVSGKVKR